MSEYLAIDGWKEFQPLRGKGSWIKDATDQSVKPKLCGLSIFTDGVLQRLRRLRGRTGKNILYDLGYIARSIHAEATDRPHLRHAIDTLIARGVLVVTNQELDFVKTPEKEREIEKEIDKKQSASAEPAIEKPKPAPKPKPSGVFDKAYESYPKHVGKPEAERAWGKAINSEVAKRVAPLAEHEDFLYQRVMHYGAVMRKKLALHQIEKQYIPHMATWLNKGRYLDDPTEWEVTRQEQANGSQTAADKAAADRAITAAAVDAGVEKFLRGKNAMGSGDVPGAVAAKSGNTG